MKQKAGKLSFIILAMTMTMGLMTGCSGKSSEKSESNDDKITLNAISFMGEDTKRNGFNKVIEAYEKANPGVEIKIQNLDYGTFTTTLQTRIGANDAPDLIFGTAILNQELVKSGQIEILNDYDILDQFTEDQLSCMTIEGNTYGVPLDRMVICAFYNKDMFEEYHVEVPSTLSEFYEVCQTFEEAGVTPFIRPYKDAAYIQYDLDTQLYPIIDKIDDVGFFTDLESGKTSFSSSKEMKEALELFAKRLSYLSGDDLGTDPAVSSQLFAAGESPMYINGSWTVGDILANNPDGNFGIFAVPISDNEDEIKMYAAVDDAWMVSSKSKHKENAIDFLKFLTSTEGLQIWSENAKAIPINGMEVKSLDPLLQEVSEYIQSGKIVNVDKYVFFSGEATDKFNKNMQLFVNDPDVEKTLKTLDSEFQIQ